MERTPTDIALGRIWVWGGGLVAFLSLVLHMGIGLNNDTLTLVHQTQKMLAGATPYIGYVEINPPLINLLFTLPVFLAQATGIKLYVALNLFAAAVGLLSLFVSARLLRTGGASMFSSALALNTLALGLFVLSFMHQLYADREYLLVAFVAPFFVLYSPLVSREHIPLHWRITASLMAGIGFALKPYALALYAAAIVGRIIFLQNPRSLWREPEHWIIAACGLVYAAIVWIFFREYIATILPVAAATYDVIGWGWFAKREIIGSQLLGNYAVPGIIAALLLVIALPAFYHRTISYLLLLMAGSIGSYLLSAGWYYTQYPFMVVSLLLAVAAGGGMLSACSHITEAPRRRLAIAAVILGITASFYNSYARPIMTQVSWDMQLMQHTGKPMNSIVMYPPTWERVKPHLATHPRFLWLAFDLWAPNILDDNGAYKSVGRFDYLWPLPGILSMKHSPAQQKKYHTFSVWLQSAIADDIATHRPDMIIVDISPVQRVMPLYYRLLDFFNEDPGFAEQFSAYALAEKVHACAKEIVSSCAYEIYYRK